MRKSAIRLLSVLMAVILGITSGNIGAYANTISGNDVSTSKNMKEHVGISENELDVEGTSSFGKMFAEAIEEKEYEQQKNNGYNIFSIEMNGNTASVELDAVDDCTLVVGIYDETGEKLLNVGTTTVAAGSEKASLVIDTASESMPTYFYLRGFLVDTYTYRPLCTVYESPNYTQEMQEFFAKTTTDFAADRVLNFDNSADNNFAIYKDDVVVVEKNDTSNQFECVDETSQKYVVENADGTVTSLSSGDIFVYEEADEVYIIKVAHVDVDETTATIYGSDASMEEVFSYIKIDASSDTEDTEVDTTDCDAGVEYAGKVQTPDESTYTTESAENDNTMQEEVDGEGSVSTKLQYNLLDTESVKGSVDFNLELTVKFFLTHSYQYLELKIKYTVGISVSLSDKADCPIKLGELKQVPFFGVIIKEKLCFIVECEAKLSFTGTLSGQIGAKISSDEGVSDLSSAPKLKTEFKGEVSFFVGLGFDPEVEVVSEHIADAKLKTRVGVEAKGTLAPSENTESERHDCKVCIDGDINFKASASFSAKLFSKWKYTYNIAGFTVKICDWYYSADLNKFGWSNCPNRSYRVDITVQDENGKSINGVNIYVDKNSANMCLNAVNGKAHDYLKMGSHVISVEADGYGSVCQKVKVEGMPRSVVVYLGKNGTAGKDNGDGLENNTSNEEMHRISFGDMYSGIITKDGSLYMWGENDYGQLGNGTTIDSNVPIKILDHVKSVSVGSRHSHSGAITEDGSLYMWGENDHGQLGTGIASNVPVKILDHVKSISFGGMGSCGAITEDGSLYMWGNNEYGQLGTGTRIDSNEPIKILDHVRSISLGGDRSGAIMEDGSFYEWGGIGMSLVPVKVLDDVRSISLGESHSAAITEDGSLYMRGDNYYGQLGDGSNNRSNVPIKILDHVKRVVSLGCEYSGAITEDGSLYMWGYNKFGQIGDGTTTNCLIPTKILENVKDVQFSEQYAGAVTEDGELYMWGNNWFGQIGNRSYTDSLVPTKVLQDVEMISLGSRHSGAITKDGSLYTWGSNNWGELGYGRTGGSCEIPTKVNILLQTESNEAYTESSLASNNVKKVSTQSGTLSFSGLQSQTTYNFYIMKSKDKENVWITDNLLYIKQVKSDSSGNITTSYYSTEACENADAFLVRAEQTDLSNAVVSVPDLTYNGQDQFVKATVNLNGQVLVEGRDYDLEGAYFAKDVGQYKVVVRGIGMYCGTKNATYSVKQQNSNGDNTGQDNNTNKDNNAKTQIESFVKRMYTVALSREAETAGLNDWSSKLSNQEIDGAGIANGFINSAEFKNRNLNNNDYLDVLYRTFFDREADAGGKAYWMGKLQKGISRTEVLSGFVNSQEFSNLCDRFGIARGTMQANGSSIYRPGVRGYVLRMYTKALNRDGETVGVEDWTNRINAKVMSPETVAKSFFSSQEFINRNLNNADYVETLYQTFMDRASDAGGKQYWINKLNSGMSRQQVLEGFSRSEEFSKIMKRYGL